MNANIEKIAAVNAIAMPAFKAGTVINPLGKVCYAVYNPACTVTFAGLNDEIIQTVTGDTKLTVAGINGMTNRLFDATVNYVVIDQRNRLASGDKDETGEMLNQAEKVVSDLAKAWFAEMGSRDPRNKKDPKAKRRPLFGLSHGDITATLYHAVGGIQKEHENDKAAQYKAFFERMLITTGAMMDGKAFADTIGDVNERAVRAAKTAAKNAARDKAQKTRQANEVAAEKARIEQQRKDEEAKAQELQLKSMKEEITALKTRNEELNKLVQDNEDKPANEGTGKKSGKKSEKAPTAVNLFGTIEAINKSDATADQKKAIIAALTAELAKAGISIK